MTAVYGLSVNVGVFGRFGMVGECAKFWAVGDHWQMLEVLGRALPY